MRARFAELIFALLLIAAAVLLGFLSTRFGFRADWSAQQRASLGQQSQDLLRSLDGPVEVVSYASDGGVLRGAIADFVARYQQLKPDIALRFIDPTADPAGMRELGVRVDGELDIRYHGRSERLKLLTEREFSNALLRVSRAHERVIAFLSGDGERKPDGAANADLGQFSQLLLGQGVRAVPLVLGANATIPDNTDLVVVANPRVAVAASSVAALTDWIERGGALLWLVEPDEAAGLDELAKALSVRVLGGTLVDGAGAQLGLGDPSFVAISTYPEHAITRGFDLTTLFPQAVALAQLGVPRWELKPLLRSSAQSWSEAGVIPKNAQAETSIRFDPDSDEIRGPLDLGFALSRLSPRPDRREQRAVVIGDGDFLSNSFLGNAGNRELGQRVFNWLLADDALIEVPDRGAPDRELQLSQTALGVLGIGFLIGLPLSLCMAGGLIWWRRRRR